MTIALSIIIAVLASILGCVTFALVMTRRELKEQKIICANLKTWQPKWKEDGLRRTALRMSATARLSNMIDAADALDREFERLRDGENFVDLAKIGEWFIESGYRDEYGKLGYGKLSNWINSISGWEIRRNYEGYPAILMRKEGN